MNETQQISGWLVMVMGMGIVFFGLVALIYITKAMSFFCGLKKEDAPKQIVAAPIHAAPILPAAPIANRPQFVAAIASAIAVQMGTEPSGLRIHSIRPMGVASDRSQFVAAVSAAVATQMGADVSGLKIHSIRQV